MEDRKQWQHIGSLVGSLGSCCYTESVTALCSTVALQVAAFGKTTLGLTYSLVLGEAVLSPAIPSVAARAGGIFFPLAKVRLGFRIQV